MPRASRHYLPGHIWHLTHRCHRKQFLLKFLKDRRIWTDWLYTARRRFGLCVLDYTVTSNHIHLIVRDRGCGEIARSMPLVAGCTGQQFNDRKHRRGAFWEDRYHATAVESGKHLARCVVYVDLNMVRAVSWPTRYNGRPAAIMRSKSRRGALESSTGGRLQTCWKSRWPILLRGTLSGSLKLWPLRATLESVNGRAASLSAAEDSWKGSRGALKSRANGRDLASIEPFENSFVLREPAAIYGRAFASQSSAEAEKEAIVESKLMSSHGVNLVRPEAREGGKSLP